MRHGENVVRLPALHMLFFNLILVFQIALTYHFESSSHGGKIFCHSFHHEKMLQIHSTIGNRAVTCQPVLRICIEKMWKQIQEKKFNADADLDSCLYFTMVSQVLLSEIFKVNRFLKNKKMLN